MNEFAAISPQIWLDPVIANFRIAFAGSSLSPTSFECWLDLSSILRHGWKHWLSSPLTTLCVLLGESCESISLYTSWVPYFLVNCEPPKAIHFITCKKWGRSGLFNALFFHVSHGVNGLPSFCSGIFLLLPLSWSQAGLTGLEIL